MFHRILIVGTVAMTVVVPHAPAQAAPTCFGETATIVGTNKDKRKLVDLFGTSGDDVIVGLKGADNIKGKGGDDLICSGDGDDWILSGSGDDRVKAGPDIDDIHGGPGDDEIHAGAGPAEGVYGEDGHDQLFGDAGTEDYLFGGRGDDAMDGGNGADVLMFPDAARGIHVDLAAGTATGQGQDTVTSAETVIGSIHDDVMFGDDLPNSLAGGPGSDQMFGLAGDDRLRSGWGGTDLLDGGEGIDAANYYLGWDPVTADLETGDATTPGVEPGLDTLVAIENLVGSKYDDALTGDDSDNVIHGSLGNDTVDGAGGSDLAVFSDSFEVVVDLEAGTAVESRGTDTLAGVEDVFGSSFADTITGDKGRNVIFGDSGDDTIYGLGRGDTLIGAGGTDSVDGGKARDTCEGETQTACEIDAGGDEAGTRVTFTWDFVYPIDPYLGAWEDARS